ncbi:phiSA1p31-related protein [Streptomyces seoulensis]|uniref:phiSA1p31-related protein n=1 Tax=Streptomyces seoulensis TaxID=73044 RepID=UPI001FCA60BE|nr:phiSA1p31-related protein [Streptomyces seoulensis]BDH04864.1 hypothetical protein HEK131_20910 [Streptomyces seoulensis]
MIGDRFRFVDLAEHPVVVLIDDQGNATIEGEDRVCPLILAEVMFRIALFYEAAHENAVCRPTSRAERALEPLQEQAATLDREFAVWTDGTGHAWDLTCDWVDAYGRAWQWTGDLDQVSGIPLMRTEYRTDVQSLDVLREVCGPISPARNRGAA